MKRAWFAFAKAISYRRILRAQLKINSIDSVKELKVKLTNSGYKVLLLDFDGVLAPHGRPEPVRDSVHALRELLKLTDLVIYILSNKPTVERKKYFKLKFSRVKFFVCKKKKPYPDSILEIAETEKVLPSQIVVVDDRPLTGLLAAFLAGADFFFVSRPLTDYRKSPITETFFSLLRRLDRLILSIP